MTNHVSSTDTLRSPTGRFTRLEQLGAVSGEIVRYSEPLSSLSLLSAAWHLPWQFLKAHIPDVPGLYLLVKPTDTAHGTFDVYVGETGLGAYRIRQQFADARRHDYRRLFCLTSHFIDLNKAHVRALEKVAATFAAGQAGITVTSETASTIKLGAYDEAIVAEAWIAGRRLLDAAGFPMDPPGSAPNSDPSRNRFVKPVKPAPAPRPRSFEFRPGSKTCFADLRATLVETNPGKYEIQAGAIYRTINNHQLSRSVTWQRKRATAEGLLEPIAGMNDRSRLLRPVSVSTPLVAASFLAGYSVNNPDFWVEIDAQPVELWGGA
jgi:hypothetical protein